MVVLGADLSYTRTGLVWLNEKFEILKQQDMVFKPGPKRLLRILKLLTEAVKQTHVDFAIIEDLAYGAPSRIVVTKLAELGAMMKVVLEANNVDYLPISPSAIKKAVTGKGSSEKDVVARELERLYGIHFENDKGYDLSDAAAAACWGMRHVQGVKQ